MAPIVRDNRRIASVDPSLAGGSAGRSRAGGGRLARALAALLFLLSTPARAQGLRVSVPVDVSVTLGGAGAWVVTQGAREELAPHCRWCDRDAAGHDTLNALDRTVRSLRWRRADVADTLSNISAFAATPLAAAGGTALAASHDARPGQIGDNTLLIAESGVLAADLNQLVKLVVLRERPAVHTLALAEPGLLRHSAEDDLSFYSGHTTEAVSLAVAAGTVSSMRGYRLAPLVWGTSLPLALVTGYLRIGADRHYLTDVLTGAVVGAAVGCLVPYVLHRADTTSSQTPPTGQAAALSFSGVW